MYVGVERPMTAWTLCPFQITCQRSSKRGWVSLPAPPLFLYRSLNDNITAERSVLREIMRTTVATKCDQRFVVGIVCVIVKMSRGREMTLWKKMNRKHLDKTECFQTSTTNGYNTKSSGLIYSYQMEH